VKEELESVRALVRESAAANAEFLEAAKEIAAEAA
jgi:hypothetical protein